MIYTAIEPALNANCQTSLALLGVDPPLAHPKPPTRSCVSFAPSLRVSGQRRRHRWQAGCACQAPTHEESARGRVPVKPVVAQPCARVFLSVRGALSLPLSCSLSCVRCSSSAQCVCLLAVRYLSRPPFAPSCALSFVRSLAFLSCLGSCLNSCFVVLVSVSRVSVLGWVVLCCPICRYLRCRRRRSFDCCSPLSRPLSRLRALSVSLAAAVLLSCAVDQSVATCVYVLPSRTTACPRCLGALPLPPHPASCLLLPSASSCVTFACSHRRYVPKSLPPVHHTPVRA